MITAWRLSHKKHTETAFSGEGAKRFGGRWNPPGYAAVYAADSLSLAILEMIVHLDEDQDIQSYVAIPVEFEENLVLCWPTEELPKGWACLPISDVTQQMGKAWLDEKKSLVLKVPSSVVRNDSNFVINPLHPDFPKIKTGSPQSLLIDPRLSDRIQ
jgi:RES domain-containing protein